MKVEFSLKWPQGQPRTLIGSRQDNRAWKKNFKEACDALAKEMKTGNISEFTITLNSEMNWKQDPGVAVWWSRKKESSHSWQSVLEIDNPLPSRREIEDAFVHKAKAYHPDREDGGDPVLFNQYNEAKQAAINWISGKTDNEFDSVLACDRFKEPRWNVNAIRMAINGMRRLERYGIPGIVERTAAVKGILAAQGVVSEPTVA